MRFLLRQVVEVATLLNLQNIHYGNHTLSNILYGELGMFHQFNIHIFQWRANYVSKKALLTLRNRLGECRQSRTPFLLSANAIFDERPTSIKLRAFGRARLRLVACPTGKICNWTVNVFCEICRQYVPQHFDIRQIILFWRVEIRLKFNVWHIVG